jgi:hypothetical protein
MIFHVHPRLRIIIVNQSIIHRSLGRMNEYAGSDDKNLAD